MSIINVLFPLGYYDHNRLMDIGIVLTIAFHFGTRGFPSFSFVLCAFYR
jgi:hypothetical protein